jgi:hypothetical protein
MFLTNLFRVQQPPISNKKTLFYSTERRNDTFTVPEIVQAVFIDPQKQTLFTIRNIHWDVQAITDYLLECLEGYESVTIVACTDDGYEMKHVLKDFLKEHDQSFTHISLQQTADNHSQLRTISIDSFVGQ